MREYLHFLNIAIGSASEAEYLVTLANRLAFLAANDTDDLVRGYAKLSAALRAMTHALRRS